MSHFKVIVVGDDVDGQLSAFHEFECTGIDDEHVQDTDITDQFKSDFEVYGEGKSIVDFARDWHNYDCILPDVSPDISDEHKFGYVVITTTGELVQAIRRTNPAAKWDWYEIGGRYSGSLLLKSGTLGFKGDRCWTNRNDFIPDHLVDQTQWGNIDIQAMRDEVEREIRETYSQKRTLLVAAGFSEDAKWRSWNEISHEFADREACRKAYWSQAEIKAVQSLSQFVLYDYDDLLLDEESSVRLGRDNVPSCFAIVKNGNWHERGHMHMFGIVSDEVSMDKWIDEKAKLLADLDPETLITVVDCHV